MAVRQGPYGWIDDTAALRMPWGFDFSDITSPVLLWHGQEDRFAPGSHTLWLGKQIPHAQVRIEPLAGHFASVEILPEVLALLTDPAALAPLPSAGSTPHREERLADQPAGQAPRLSKGEDREAAGSGSPHVAPARSDGHCQSPPPAGDLVQAESRLVPAHRGAS